MATKKHPRPPRVRPKVGLDQSLTKKLDQSQNYLVAQQKADPQNKLASEVTALTTARTNLVTLLNTQTDLKAALDVNQAQIVVALAEHDEAMMDYAREAAKLANGDASIL